MSLISVVTDVETAHADLIAKTYATFMGVIEKSRTVAIVWVMAAVSLLAVLLWHQVGLPLLTYGYRVWWGDQHSFIHRLGHLWIGRMRYWAVCWD